MDGAQQAAPLRMCSSGGGIRSLPDALHTTSYHQQLQQQLQQTACSADQPQQQQQPQQQHPEEHSRQWRRQRDSSKLQHQPGSLTAPQRYGPLRGWGFSCWGHATSEYGRAEVLQKLETLRGKAAQVAGEDFVVRGCPPPLLHSPTFSNSTGSSTLPPFQDVDWLGRPLHQQQQPVRPFVPAGRGGIPEMRLRGQLPEVLVRLDAQLSRCFPGCFIKAFADQSEDGAIVLSFLERQQQQQQGGSSSAPAAYLNHAVQHDPLLVEHRLTRDASRWGVRDAAAAGAAECSDDDGGAGSPPLLFFVLLPPWCRGGGGRAAAARA